MENPAPYFISAVCTPLTEDDRLHEESLGQHLADQWNNGIHGILVAGTMGLLQLLTDETYRSLCEHSIRLSRGKGEVMIGAGDASLARTLARVDYLNGLNGVDGVVILTPYFVPFAQSELVDYFTAIADASTHPVYLYDLPQRTHCKVEVDTVQAVIRHQNIKGIKCSDEIVSTRLLIDRLGGETRVVVAQPLLVDVLLKAGINIHLDGLFAVAPKWAAAIGQAAVAGDWNRATAFQQKFVALVAVLREFGVFPAVSAILNAKGMPGRFAPRPYRMLDERRRAELLKAAIVRELVAD